MLLLYDIANKKSFDRIPQLYHDIKKKINTEVNILLVGAKRDLTHLREVDEDSLIKMGKRLRVNTIEVSSLQNYNIDESFILLMKNLLSMIVEMNGYIPYFDEFLNCEGSSDSDDKPNGFLSRLTCGLTNLTFGCFGCGKDKSKLQKKKTESRVEIEAKKHK